jgi:hypothetical protein
MIPFSLIWGGFAFFWEAGVLGLIPLGGKNGHAHPAPIFMAIFGIPFCVIGFYLIFLRFFADAFIRRKTWYGITDKRVIVLKSAFTTNVNSIDYASLTNLNLTERKDNSGDILFGFPSSMQAWANSGWPQSRRYPQTPGFYLLPDARQIYNRIREIQQKSRS